MICEVNALPNGEKGFGFIASNRNVGLVFWRWTIVVWERTMPDRMIEEMKRDLSRRQRRELERRQR